MPELAFARCRRQDGDYVGAALRHLGSSSASGCVHITNETAKPRTPRETLQLWGTQFRRHQDPDYWMRRVRDSIRAGLREHQTRFVVTDVRYGNEAQAVRNFGGVLWQVTRPGCAGELEHRHSSATDGTEFAPDLVIANRHDLRHLQQHVLGEYWARDAGLPPGSVRAEITA